MSGSWSSLFPQWIGGSFGAQPANAGGMAYNEGGPFSTNTSSGLDPNYFLDPGASGLAGANIGSPAGGNWPLQLPGALNAAAKAAQDLNKSTAAPAPKLDSSMQPGRPMNRMDLATLIAMLQKRDMNLFPAFGQTGQPPQPIRSTGGLLGF